MNTIQIAKCLWCGHKCEPILVPDEHPNERYTTALSDCCRCEYEVVITDEDYNELEKGDE